MSAKPDNSNDIGPNSQGANALPAKQELALRAVISHPTLKEAALAAGISETTLWRYMQDETFARRLREARREAMNHTITRLQKASSDAVTVLQNLMNAEEVSASARVSAARTVLDYALRAVEVDELQSRIEELEEFIRAKQEGDALDSALKGEE